MPAPHQRLGNKKYAWKTPPKLPHSKSRGKKNRQTHPLKQVPSMQPGPISLPTRPKGRASTEESNRGQHQVNHPQQLKTHSLVLEFLSWCLSTAPPLHTGPAQAPTRTGPSQLEDEHAVMHAQYWDTPPRARGPPTTSVAITATLFPAHVHALEPVPRLLLPQNWFCKTLYEP